MGLLDGTLNNADIIDHVSALNSNINSDPTTSENRNANTRADGKQNNSVSQDADPAPPQGSPKP